MCVRDLLEMEKKIDEKIRMRKKRDKGTRRLNNDDDDEIVTP